jgi:hypothetical protein
MTRKYWGKNGETCIAKTLRPGTNAFWSASKPVDEENANFSAAKSDIEAILGI